MDQEKEGAVLVIKKSEIEWGTPGGWGRDNDGIPRVSIVKAGVYFTSSAYNKFFLDKGFNFLKVGIYEHYMVFKPLQKSDNQCYRLTDKKSKTSKNLSFQISCKGLCKQLGLEIGEKYELKLDTDANVLYIDKEKCLTKTVRSKGKK